MVCAGTAVLLHVQKFWIISAESNDLLALAQRFEQRDSAKLALDQLALRLDRRFGWSGDVKLTLDRRLGESSGAKLALNQSSGRPTS